MGWLKTLGKIGGYAAAVGLAPYTGGASMSIIPAMNAISGGASKAAQTQNNFEAANQPGMESAKLNRDKFAVASPASRLSAATRASLTNNFTPTKVDWQGPGSGMKGILPRISGGFSGGMANLDPTVKQLSSRIIDDSFAGQMRGGETGGQMDRYVDPNVGKSGTMDKVMGGVSMGSSILEALIKARQGGGGGYTGMFEDGGGG